VAFLSGPGTCAQTSPPMYLPVPLIENIKAMVYRKVYAGPHSDPGLWIPVLSKYVQDVLDWTTYTYTKSGVLQQSFADPASVFQEKVVGKGNEVYYKPLVETPVDYVDGFSGSNYLAVNDPNRLMQLTGIWNEWVTGSMIQSHSCQLAQWSTDLGISVLNSIGITRHSQTGGIGRREQLQANHNVDKRLTNRNHKYLVDSPYSTRVFYTTSFHDKPFASCWENVQNTWILPINEVADGPIAGVTQSTRINRVSAMYNERFSITQTINEAGSDLANLHSAYASKMVKGRLAASTQWDDFFKQMEAYGRGGILSALAGGVAKMIFPSSGHIIDQISNAIPI